MRGHGRALLPAPRGPAPAHERAAGARPGQAAAKETGEVFAVHLLLASFFFSRGLPGIEDLKDLTAPPLEIFFWHRLRLSASFHSSARAGLAFSTLKAWQGLGNYSPVMSSATKAWWSTSFTSRFVCFGSQSDFPVGRTCARAQKNGIGQRVLSVSCVQQSRTACTHE